MSISHDRRSLDRSIEFHLWANDRVLNSLRRMTQPPARAVTLFVHTVRADRIWMVRAGEMEGMPDYHVPADISLVTAAHEWDEMRSFWLELAGRLDDVDLDRMVSFTTSKGEPFTHSFDDILGHLFIHGVHHRAQIQSMIREAGETPQPIDLIVWRREQEGE